MRHRADGKVLLMLPQTTELVYSSHRSNGRNVGTIWLSLAFAANTFEI